MPSLPSEQIKVAMMRKMESHSPRYMSNMRAMLLDFAHAIKKGRIPLSKGLKSLTIEYMREVWPLIRVGTRSHLRGILEDIAENGRGEVDHLLLKEMRTWKARDDVEVLKCVVNWDSTRGALITAEAEIFRHNLKKSEPLESDHDCAVRIHGWISDSLLKRTSQITSMRKSALQTFETNGVKQYFSRIPPVKAQASRKAKLWQITAELALAIQAYSARPAIRALQERYDRLIVIPGKNGKRKKWMEHGQVSSWHAGNALRDWVLKRKIMSPRTGSIMHVVPSRIRHTGGTQMAKQGRSRQEIQDVLEQDSPFSAQAYIDSIAEDLVPLYEKTSNRLGDVFRPLKEAYFFKGKLVSTRPRKPISIPVVVEGQLPAVVGGCGKRRGKCHKHPFLACYDQCRSFLAWKEGDHQRALAYVESEAKRWNAAEESDVRSKSIKDFDRIAASIREVIGAVEADKSEKG